MHILAYPPHCTHVLQGLDVVCFAKMKRIWNTALDNFEDKHMRGPNKEDFPKLFGEAFLQAFTKETILSAFRVTGIFPFNRAIITEEHIKPSEPTTFTKNTFPQPLPEPIHGDQHSPIKNRGCRNASHASASPLPSGNHD